MEENQQKQRRTAAQEFEESLEQLQNILHEDENTEEENTHSISDTTNNSKVTDNSSGIDLASWEDAVADIEQYLENKNKDKNKSVGDG
ncbi:hypothetical protein [Mastigocoleus testarum]|uniref:Uncharacterized protein n=1 Tax=Mastigocoleus testarum BC008 TaxID=371196 RepID=A0A0V7ZQP3_9CYAN|nr:hypothetical protein [Mastigocoleus testarum]KST66824.1 hypothetical protein BC008_26905 [Mastigocoleus testarum BC008]KST70161.1 hypothetical protein BC008_36510 [Mastigocoleus testarum BC008]